jgi:hypothetical protein
MERRLAKILLPLIKKLSFQAMKPPKLTLRLLMMSNGSPTRNSKLSFTMLKQLKRLSKKTLNAQFLFSMMISPASCLLAKIRLLLNILPPNLAAKLLLSVPRVVMARFLVNIALFS